MENCDEKAKVLASKYLFKKPWLTVRQEKIELPNGVIVPEYYILEYRHGSQTTNYEFCGGCVDPEDESPMAAAQRELFEETGYGNGTWKMNMKMSTNPSTNANWTYNFIAEDVELLDSKQHLDGGECLTVHLLTLDEIKQLLKENGIIQSLHACALWKYIAENHLL